MRNYVHITCFLLGFFRLSVNEAHAEPPQDTDVITPSKSPTAQRWLDDDDYVSARNRKYGVGDIDIYARYARAARGGSANGLTDLGTIGFDLHTFYGKESGYAFGLGFDLGTGVDTTFVYGAHISPLGWGVALGPSGYVMLIGGIGVDGATSRVPLSGIFPVQLLVAYNLGSRLRLGVDAGLTWTTNSDRVSAHNLSAGDELDLGTSLRIGRSFAQHSFNFGRGYFFRLDRKEQMGTSFFGFSIGIEIDGSG